MAITTEEIIYDLEKYISLFNVVLTKEARKTFLDIEEFSLKCNHPCRSELFFSKTIRNMKEMQKFFYSKGMNPALAAMLLEMGYYDSLDTQMNYQKGTKLYSYMHDRSRHDKTAILDRALQYCVKSERAELENKDILLAAMDYFEEYLGDQYEPWKDERLNCGYITLTHVLGKYDENLWVRFGDIRQHLSECSYAKVKLRWI